MSTEIPNLWPDNIKLDVLTPYAILKVQAEQLAKQTQGLLEAHVESDEEDDDRVIRFKIVAPAIDMEMELLQVTHKKDVPYPASIYSAWIPMHQQEASLQETFMNVISAVFNHDQTMITFQALIARSNEARSDTD